MQTLIAQWRLGPNTLLHAKIVAYHRKHPFAELFLNEADQKTLRSLVGE